VVTTGAQQRERLSSVVIRFAGDSGDGMQLLGDQFTRNSALVGNDIATLPDYPAEIRAPAGTREGVSGFQLQFSESEIFTPGDDVDVLVAMNPAALVKNLGALKPGGLVVVNSDSFKAGDLAKAKVDTNPLEDGTLARFRVVQAPIAVTTTRAVAPHGLNAKQADRCKNFFALGMMYWLYGRSMESTVEHVKSKFKQPFLDANIAALQAGHDYAATVELFQTTYEVPKARLAPGKYRNITGNAAIALGFVAAAQRSGVTVFYGSYPITPASDILHSLAPYKNFGVATFQAEDEIAAVAAAIGASWGGALGVCGTSGPGVALKGEAIGLAVMTELPLVVVDVQRGGPSTGLPTKTEQADLLQAMYGRNGEAPVAIIATSTPSDCFDATLQACKIAMQFMCPVMLLSDGYIANGAEPWPVPDLTTLPDLRPTFRTDAQGFLPYGRDPVTLARPVGQAPARRASSTASAASRSRRLRPRQLRPSESRKNVQAARREDPPHRRHVAPDRGVRRRRRRAGRRLGLHLGRHPHRGRSPPSRRRARRADPPPLAQPAAQGPRRAVAPVRPRARARAQPRPAQQDPARRVPRRLRAAHQDPGAALPDPRRSKRASTSSPPARR
jgi:2-oxoglutarate ferredoxin oxidoreductase subunit alpha